jgi:hypothetical protein
MLKENQFTQTSLINFELPRAISCVGCECGKKKDKCCKKYKRSGKHCGGCPKK